MKIKEVLREYLMRMGKDRYDWNREANDWGIFGKCPCCMPCITSQLLENIYVDSEGIYRCIICGTDMETIKKKLRMRKKKVVKITCWMDFIGWDEKTRIGQMDWDEQFAKDMCEEVFMEIWIKTGKTLFKEIKKVVK